MFTVVFIFLFSFLPLWFGTKIDDFAAKCAISFIIVVANLCAASVGKSNRQSVSERIFGKIPVDEYDRPLEKDKMDLFYHNLDSSSVVMILIAGVATFVEISEEVISPIWFGVGICILFIILEIAYISKAYSLLDDLPESIALGTSGLLSMYGRIGLIITLCLAFCIGFSIAALLLTLVICYFFI